MFPGKACRNGVAKLLLLYFLGGDLLSVIWENHCLSVSFDRVFDSSYVSAHMLRKYSLGAETVFVSADLFRCVLVKVLQFQLFLS